MTIKLRLEQPDIILVEDLSTLNTSCVILHTELQGDVKLSDSQRIITAGLTNLQMYTCVFDPAKRNKSLSQILNRSILTVHCSSTKQHADSIQLNFGILEFRLTPDIIELIVKILGTLTTEEVETSPKEEKIKDWTGLWNPQAIDTNMFPTLAIEEGTEAFSDIATPPKSPQKEQNKTIKGEGLNLNLECLIVTLEAGSGSRSIPLLKLQATTNITAEGFYGKILSTSGDLTIEMVYYNPRLAVWEPVIEQIETFGMDGQSDFKPFTLNFEVNYVLLLLLLNTNFLFSY